MTRDEFLKANDRIIHGESFSLPDGTRIDPDRVSDHPFVTLPDVVPFQAVPKRTWLRWPRGKYNRLRITGISIKAQIDLEYWTWWPVIGHHCGCFHWLCFMSWTEFVYESNFRV